MTDTEQHLWPCQPNLCPYRPTWRDDYRAEKVRLQAVFGAAALEIEHIGSTAIEGMPSKPIIDIAVMIARQMDADGFIVPLAEIGYEYVPQASSGERHFLTKCRPARYHLSIAYADVGGYWHRQIVFRNYLRSNQGAREEYALLKADLLCQYPSGQGEYCSGKTEFIFRILRSAGWREGQLYRDEG